MTTILRSACFVITIFSFGAIGIVSRASAEQPRGTCTVSGSSLVFLPSAAVRTSVAVQTSATCTGRGGTLTVQLKDNGRAVAGTARSCRTAGRACTATSGFVANVRGHSYSAAATAVANP